MAHIFEGYCTCTCTVLHQRCLSTCFPSLSLLIEVLDGIKVYFDFMLGDHLLYPEEAQQYKETVSKKTGRGGGGGLKGGGGGLQSVAKGKGYKEVVLGTPPSTLYGVEHLLRLFGEVVV